MKQTTAIILSLSVMLAACKTIQTPDGQVPPSSQGAVSQIVGTYSGTIREYPSQNSPATREEALNLQLSLDGDRLVVKSDNEILDGACASSVGSLQSMDVSDNGQILYRAVLGFDPNLCPGKVQVPNPDVVLMFRQNNDGTIDLSMFLTLQVFSVGGAKQHEDKAEIRGQFVRQ